MPPVDPLLKAGPHSGHLLCAGHLALNLKETQQLGTIPPIWKVTAELGQGWLIGCGRHGAEAPTSSCPLPRAPAYPLLAIRVPDAVPDAAVPGLCLDLDLREKQTSGRGGFRPTARSVGLGEGTSQCLDCQRPVGAPRAEQGPGACVRQEP